MKHVYWSIISEHDMVQLMFASDPFHVCPSLPRLVNILQLILMTFTICINWYSYGPLPVISTYNPIYRMYNPI